VLGSPPTLDAPASRISSKLRGLKDMIIEQARRGANEPRRGGLDLTPTSDYVAVVTECASPESLRRAF